MLRRVRGGACAPRGRVVAAGLPVRRRHRVRGVRVGAVADVDLVSPRLDDHHQDDGGRSDLRAAHGLRFTRAGAPVWYPDKDAQAQFEWPGGVEDPRLIEAPDGTYVLTYTQWNRDIPRLAIATSRDLVHWTKHGPAFARAGGGRYRDLESKSGAILGQVAGNRVIATAVRGKYGMYFNVLDSLIETSDDLA